MSRTVKKQTISHSNNAEVMPFQIKSAKVVKSLSKLSVGSCTPKKFSIWDVSKQSISSYTRNIMELTCSKQLNLHVSPRFSFNNICKTLAATEKVKYNLYLMRLTTNVSPKYICLQAKQYNLANL